MPGVTGGFDGMQRDCGVWNTSVVPMHTGCKPATAEMILALGAAQVTKYLNMYHN